MAKQIVVWCDPCLGADQHTASHEVKIGLDNRWMTLDLCEEHEKALLVPLRELLSEFGAPVSETIQPPAKGRVAGRATGNQSQLTLMNASLPGAPRKGRPTGDDARVSSCLWCPLTYAKGGGLQRHVKVAHGWPTLGEALGDRCPICGVGTNLMLNHLRREHPDLVESWECPTQGFMWARENGDPHGVVAERTAATGPLDPDEAWAIVRKSERRSHAHERELDE